MTQKEKLMKAFQFAVRVDSLADRLDYDGKDYGVYFTRSYVKELKDLSNELKKILK
ncbi:MAG: hypothetical protein Q4A15_11550 [Prevotellaceae bacterium]|nr:hypothetical protein [Prevotellaceae bacterium]